MAGREGEVKTGRERERERDQTKKKGERERGQKEIGSDS